MSDGVVGTTRRGTNQPRMGDFNQSVILDAIRRSGEGLSRIQLAADTGLAPGSVTNISRRLLELGYIEEAGRIAARGGAGKPRTLLRIVSGSKYALGVHLDPSRITAVLLDLGGAVVTSSRRPAPLDASPHVVVSEIADAIEEILDTAGVDRGRVHGLGVATPGPIDPVAGIVVDPPNLGLWHDVPLATRLHEAVGFETMVDKDVTAAAVAEAWTIDVAPEDFLFVYIGTGIAATLVVGGEVRRGVSSNAGEVGHLVVDPSGPLCSCGQWGCLAVSATPDVAVRKGIEAGVVPSRGDLSSVEVVDTMFRQLVTEGVREPGVARDIVEGFIDRLGSAVGSLVNFTDVGRVVIGGPFWSEGCDPLLGRLHSAVERVRVTRGVHDLAVSSSRLGPEVAAIGAASQVLDTLSPRAGTLLLR